MMRLVPLLGTAWLLAAPASLKGQSEAGAVKPNASMRSRNKTAPAEWTAPLTSNGRPELSGVWIDSWATPLESPKELAGRQFLTDQSDD
jgi:hypothetical protein